MAPNGLGCWPWARLTGLPFVVTSLHHSYRRLDAWLVHGLSNDTTVEHLASKISICELGDGTSQCANQQGGASSLPFNLTLVDRGTARLSIPALAEGHKYRIVVQADPNVKDGFGQGLQASSTDFLMSVVESDLEAPSINGQLAILEAGADNLTQWPYIAHRPDGYYGYSKASAWVLDTSTPKGVDQLLDTLLRSNYPEDLTGKFGEPAAQIQVPSDILNGVGAPQWSELQLALPQLTPGNGSKGTVAVLQMCCSEQSNDGEMQILINSSLSLNLVSGGSPGTGATAWVLDTRPGGGPVAGAEVILFGETRFQQDVLYKQLGSCTTGQDGVCVVTHVEEADYWPLVAFARSPDGQVALLPSAGWLQQPSTPAAQAALVLDRKAVVEGDSLKVTGFAQAVLPDLTLGLLPAGTRAVLEVSPPWEQAGGGGVSGTTSSSSSSLPPRVFAQVDGTSGTLHAEVPVPPSVRLQQYSIMLRLDPKSIEAAQKASNTTTSNTTTITIENSRSKRLARRLAMATTDPDTGITAIALGPEDTPEQRDPRSLLQDGGDAGEDPYAAWPSVASESFTVADPRPPTVELKLTLPPWAPNGSVVPVSVLAVSYIGASVADANVTLTWSTPLASGVLPLATDAGGAANGTIDLAALPEANRTTEYDTLSVTAEWIGPTRERIVQTQSMTLANAPYRLTLSRSTNTDVLGVAFTVDAALTSNAADGSPLNGTTVNITLTPNTTEAAACASNTTASVVPGTRTCTAVSGAGYSTTCQLTLPCVGQFELRGCADVPISQWGNTTTRVCSNMIVGRSSSSWAGAPWNGHPDVTLQDNKSSHSLGDTVTVSLTNPWPGARLLLVWGNQLATRSKVVDKLPSGPLVSASFGPLGPECRGGCSLAAVLDVPRLRPQDFPPARNPGMPVSKLFDPLAPHTHTMTLALTVRQDNHLEVAVQVAGGEGGALATVRDADGKEVPAVQPGQQAQVKVTVKVPAAASAGGGNASSSASTPSPGIEVTLYAVDKAFLDLLPYGLPAVQEAMVLQLASSMQAQDMAAYRLAPGAVRAVYDTMMRRLTKLDPWLPVDTAVTPYSSGTASVDMNDTAYLNQYSSAITYMTNSPCFASEWASCATFPMGDAFWSNGNALGSGIFNGPTAMAVAQAVSMAAVGGAAAEASALAMPSPAPSADNASSSKADFGGGGGGGGGSSSGSTPAAPRSAGDFVVTPLFAVATTDATGVATFNFTGPQKLGAFVLRAFAASGSSAKFGSSESRIVVRRQLSLVPSVPRFVRVNDTFEAGIIVTVPTAPATVTITAKLVAPANASANATVGPAPLVTTGQLTKTIIFQEGKGLSTEARFEFAAVAVGTAAVQFDAEATVGGEAARDGLKVDIPVQGQQGDVMVATTFALQGSTEGAAQWQEGMELPSAVPGSGGLTLTAGVGYLPSILSTYNALLDDEKDRIYPEAQPSMLRATAPAVLSYYGKQLNATEANETKTGLTDLGGVLTDQTFGLLWSPVSRWPDWSLTRADIDLNTWAIFLVDAYAPAYNASSSNSSTGGANANANANATLIGSELTTLWSTTTSASLPTWRDAATMQLVKDAREIRSQVNQPYSNWETLSWIRLALGADWYPATAGAADPVLSDLSLRRQLQVFANESDPWVSLQARLVLSLALLAQGPANASPQTVSSTVDLVTGRLRVQGRTAYVAEGEGGRHAADLEDQALALLLLVRSGATHQLVPKLAAYVASPTTSTGGGPYPLWVCYPSYRGQGLAVLALSEYDRSRGSAQPNLDLSARANGMVVLQASFNTSSSNAGAPSTVTNTTPWDALPAQPNSESYGTLDFQATGSGEATVSASLLFVPSVLPAFPAYRGLYVEAALQLVDPRSGGPTGRRVAAVPLASLVALTVQLTSPDDLGAVTLEVMMPGGLEPIDPNLASGADLGPTCGAQLGGSTSSWTEWYSWWWWPVCPAQETRASVVTFSYLRLSAGTSSVTVYAVAASVGRFVLPPVRAFANDQPELMGMTAAGTFNVCADCTAPTYGEVPPPPKPCPKNCSDNGVCDLSKGTCVCSPLFQGVDCSEPVVA